MNSNDLNNKTINTNVGENHTMQTNNVTSIEPTTSPEVKNVKKKKYWLIPLIVFAVMIISIVIAMFPLMLNLGSTNNMFFTLIRLISMFILGLCGIGFIPSIIIAIVLSIQNKQK